MRDQPIVLALDLGLPTGHLKVRASFNRVVVVEKQFHSV